MGNRPLSFCTYEWAMLGSSRELLKLGVLGGSFFQDGDVWVGVFPDRLALQILHGNEAPAFVLSNLVNSANVSEG